MTENEIRRLAHAINDLRPDWPISSLTTFITNQLGKRAYRDAAIAMTWVAVDAKPDGQPASETPKRVLEAGPWWGASSVADAYGRPTLTPPKLTEACRVCNRRLESCVCGKRATKPDPAATPETVQQAIAAARAALQEASNQ